MNNHCELTGERISLHAPSTCYNSDYQSPDIKKAMETVDAQMARLRKKLNYFDLLWRQGTSKYEFARVKRVTLLESYVDVRQQADHFGTREELYFFEVITDSHTFLAGLHFCGNSNWDVPHYALYVPQMEVERFEEVKNTVLMLTNAKDYNEKIVVERAEGRF